MMAVSCTKAMLVILFFMHVLYEANWKFVLTIPAAPDVHFFDFDAGARCRHARPLGVGRATVSDGQPQASNAQRCSAGADAGEEPRLKMRAGRRTAARKSIISMSSSSAICVQNLSYRYGDRQALAEVSLEIAAGEIFIFLGPNGGGKSTLFRLLSTLLSLQTGEAEILGFDLRRQVAAIRERIGVVFQSPSVDRKLTVGENLLHQGHLYGLSGAELTRRRQAMLERFRLTDRVRDRVETLSGGLRRRVELAKGLLHHPQLLLLDEPSTGLDPAARSDMWNYLRQLREQDGVTIVLTTHLLEEADNADRIAILDRGKLVAIDSPDALRSTVGGDAVTIQTAEPERIAEGIHARLGATASVIDGAVRLEIPDGHQWIARIVEAFPGQIDAITLGKPTLEDVFIDRTGHRLEDLEMAEAEK